MSKFLEILLSLENKVLLINWKKRFVEIIVTWIISIIFCRHHIAFKSKGVDGVYFMGRDKLVIKWRYFLNM